MCNCSCQGYLKASTRIEFWLLESYTGPGLPVVLAVVVVDKQNSKHQRPLYKHNLPSLYLSVYLNFCNNLQQMRSISVFTWPPSRLRVHNKQSSGAPFCFYYLFLRLLLTLSPVFHLTASSHLATAPSALSALHVARGAQTLPLPKFHL